MWVSPIMLSSSQPIFMVVIQGVLPGSPRFWMYVISDTKTTTTKRIRDETPLFYYDFYSFSGQLWVYPLLLFFFSFRVNRYKQKQRTLHPRYRFFNNRFAHSSSIKRYKIRLSKSKNKVEI